MSDFVFQMEDTVGRRWFVIPNTREAARVLQTVESLIESATLDDAGDAEPKRCISLDRADAKKLHDALDYSYDVTVEGGRL